MDAEHAAIEIHDSELLTIEDHDSTLIVVLDAYVHRSSGRPGVDAGTGWRETARVFVAAGRLFDRPMSLPMRLEDGSLETPTESLRNVLPADRAFPGPVRLILGGFRGEMVVVTGDSIEIRLQGDSSYIEEFPGT